MFIIVELLFILLLVMILFMLYRNEMLSTIKRLSRAKVEEYWTGKERRRHVRFKKTLDVSYTIEKRPHLKNNGKTVDISQGGMKLLMCEKLAKGTILNIKLSLPNSKNFILVEGEVEGEGEVAWSEGAGDADLECKRQFYSGIKFLAIKEPTDKRLSSYLNSLSAEPGA